MYLPLTVICNSRGTSRTTYKLPKRAPFNCKRAQRLQMPDTGSSNIEVAHHLSEPKKNTDFLAIEALEIAEAFVLAIVAVATAWGGYQAARWTGYQSEQYGIATRLRVEAEGAETTANQERLYIAATVVEWLKSEAQGQRKLAEIFERRILPEFRPAFEAWKRTDPINNPNAPAGPQLMREYRNSKTEEAAELNKKATNAFEQGNAAREWSDAYVRVTVMLATVLLLIAISQRFKAQYVRVGMLSFAVLLLCFPMYLLLRLPRA